MMIRLRRKLNKELDKLVENINVVHEESPKNQPCVNESVKGKTFLEKLKDFASKIPFGKKTWGAISTAFACLVAVLVIIPLTLNSTGYDSLIVMEINPSISLLSKNQTITDVISNNSDGDVLLSEENFLLELKNKDVLSAVKLLSEKAVEYGYIKDYDYKNEIKISVLSTDNEKAISVAKNIQNGLIEHLCNKGIYSIVSGDQISVEEYKSKFNVDQKDASELIDGLRGRKPLIIDYIKPTIEEVSTMYNTQVLPKIADLIEKYIDFGAVAMAYATLLSLTDNVDWFNEDAVVPEILKGAHQSFIEQVKEFNQKHGENLNKQKFDSLKEQQQIVDGLKQIPTSIEDYVTKAGDMIRVRANDLKNKAKEFFEANKPIISKEQYNDYLNKFN